MTYLGFVNVIQSIYFPTNLMCTGFAKTLQNVHHSLEEHIPKSITIVMVGLDQMKMKAVVSLVKRWFLNYMFSLIVVRVTFFFSQKKNT